MFQHRTVRRLVVVILAMTVFLSSNIVVAAPGNAQYDDTYSEWIYSSGWTAVAGGSYSGAANGTLHLTNTPGSVASFTCTNSSAFDILFSTASNRGKFEIYVDGVRLATIDAYTSATVRQVWALGGGYYFGGTATHTFTIKTLNEKNAASSGYYVDIDAIEC